MLGLDAVSLPFILENRRGLPNLSALLDGGMLRELQSSASYLSASVWPTFSTGRQPGEHGQYSLSNGRRNIASTCAWPTRAGRSSSTAGRSGTASRSRDFQPSPSTSPTRCTTSERRACRSRTGPIKAQATRRHRIVKCSRTFSDVSGAGRSVPKFRSRRQRGSAWRSAIS